MTIIDPMKQIMNPLTEVDFSPKNTALVIVCMQKMFVHPDYGTIATGREKGLHEAMDYYTGRLPTVINNLQLLLNKCREEKYEIVHVAVESMTNDGRDKCRYHKDRSGYTKNDIGNEFIDELLPIEDELIFRKTSCGVFNSTNMQQVMQNIGIENLIVGGCITNGSVGHAVMDGADLGFNMVLVEDGCESLTPEIQQASLELLSFFTRIKSTDEVLSMI